MESRPKRQNFRNRTGLILVAIVLLSLLGCGTEAKKPDTADTPAKPSLLILPFFVQGTDMPEMAEVTETAIYLFFHQQKYAPLDLGESHDIIETFNIKGIYLNRALLQSIHQDKGIDYVMVGRIQGLTGKVEPGQISIRKATSIKINVRLFNAKTGQLKQIFERETVIRDEVRATINQLLQQVAGEL